MDVDLTPAGRAALLLVGLEPLVARDRVDAAMVLLGHRPGGAAETVDRGLVREIGGRLEAVDRHVGLRAARSASDREIRIAHLALACAGPTHEAGGAATFARLVASLQPPDAPLREDLTPQERQVAELAATGARTREIATVALLSPKTVETHLTRVYRKLGVRSKAELASCFRMG